MYAILYDPPCIEALTCRRPPRARTEIALQADVLCGLSTCRCSADRSLARLLFPRSCILLLCEGTSPVREIFAKQRDAPLPFFFKFLKIVEFLSTIGAREEKVNSDICYKVYMRERERERGATIENRSDRLSFQSPIWRGEEEEKEEEKRERTANNRA